jgi:hypothetical protein
MVLALALLPSTIPAQTTANPAPIILNTPESLSDTIKVFDAMAADHEKQKERQRQLEESPRTSRLPSQVNEMISMAWKLEDAARELQTALTLDRNLKKPAKDISKHTDVILRYLKYKGRKPQMPDMKPFERLSERALATEILASAQRIDPQLRVVFQNEMADTISIDFPQTLGPLEEEVMRVKWMVSRLK